MQGEQTTAQRLRAAIARTDRLLAREVVGTGLTRTEFSLMGAMVRSGPLGMSALVERERLHPTMLSRLVGRLAGQGWVSRTPDPDDGRAALVGITDAGRELYQRLQRERTRRIEDYLGGLTDGDARRLRDALPVLEGLVEHLLADDHDRTAAPAGGSGVGA